MAIISVVFGAILSTISLAIAGLGFGAGWNSLLLIWLATAVALPTMMIALHAMRPTRHYRRKGDLPLGHATPSH